MRLVLGLSRKPFSLENVCNINGKTSAHVMCKSAWLQQRHMKSYEHASVDYAHVQTLEETLEQIRIPVAGGPRHMAEASWLLGLRVQNTLRA
jgi:hypothetical protein